MIISLEQSANSLHMVQLMPLPPHHVFFSKIHNGFSFWYRLTRVVPDKGRKTVVVVVGSDIDISTRSSLNAVLLNLAQIQYCITYVKAQF